MRLGKYTLEQRERGARREWPMLTKPRRAGMGSLKNAKRFLGEKYSLIFPVNRGIIIQITPMEVKNETMA